MADNSYKSGHMKRNELFDNKDIMNWEFNL